MDQKDTPIISENERERMMAKEGEVRGVSLKADGEFIIKKKGEKGLEGLEKTMASVGHPVKYREIRTMDFYPLGLKGLTLVAIKRLFDFQEEDFVELGRFGASLPQVIRIFIRFFGSSRILVKSGPKMFQKYYTVGELSVQEFNEKERYARTRIDNFNLSPLHCHAHRGYLTRLVEMIVKSPATCRETKCLHEGDEYHEFLIHW